MQAIHYAASYGNKDLLISLIEQFRVDPQQNDSEVQYKIFSNIFFYRHANYVSQNNLSQNIIMDTHNTIKKIPLLTFVYDYDFLYGYHLFVIDNYNIHFKYFEIPCNAKHTNRLMNCLCLPVCTFAVVFTMTLGE